MLRLFTAAITFGETARDEHGGEGFRRIDMPVVSRSQLWWNLRNPDQASLWENEITLGEEFYDAVTAAPVPLDIRALRGLKRSPLALDLYAWCAYNAFQAHKTGRSRWISWPKFAQAVGADYGRVDNFQQKARRELPGPFPWPGSRHKTRTAGNLVHKHAGNCELSTVKR
jgi:hypothetical protein